MFRFKELFELWRSDNSLDQALNASYEMLDQTHEMFTKSVESLRHSDDGTLGLVVYDKDQMVNKYEQKVRRKVLKHLAITGGANIIPGLILTTLVIDIERIGDYTKNIMDLAVAHPKRLVAGKYEEDLQRIEKGVSEQFETVIPAFKSSDKDAAHEIAQSSWGLAKKCDEIVVAMIKGEDPSLSSGDAVSTAIYARYLKRISAHLLNITSGIVNPFEGVGFWSDEDL